MRKNILIICICSVVISVYSSGLPGGLMFNSSAQAVSKRSSLSIFENRPELFTNSFDVSFDFSIWDMNQFGFVMRVINEKNQEVDLAFVNFRGEDDLYLDFHSPITHKSVEIPLEKTYVLEKKWMSVKIYFDLKNDVAEVYFKDSVYRCETIGLSNPSRLKFVYGLWGLNLDVPQMIIRNIKIAKEGETKFKFPLNQSEGVDVADDKGRKYGTAKNPNWMINYHHYWKEKAVFPSDSASGITYDHKNERILFLNRNALSAFSLHKNIKEDYLTGVMPPRLYTGDMVTTADGRIIIYGQSKRSEDMPRMAIVDLENNAIEYKKSELDIELTNYSCFMSGNGNEMYLFGGYVNHFYTNAFRCYNFTDQSWRKEDFSGDVIVPRYRAAIGKGQTPSQLYIMGGYGNESGKQEHGGRQLHDLYEVDLEQKQVRKLWDIQKSDYGFVPFSNLILSNDKSHLYVLGNPFQESNEIVQLYQFSLEDGSFEIVSDTIHIQPIESTTMINLFYSELLQEFYAVVREHSGNDRSEIRIYSLMAPPVGADMLKEYSSKRSFLIRYILIFTFILLMGVLFVLFRNKKKNILRTQRSKRNQIAIEGKAPDKNAIFVFGDFQVLDKAGKDISYRFSAKLRSMFALILFHSTRNQKGVSTEKLTLDLWPDRDINTSKNTRGVTINRLRTILEDLEGINLTFKNSKWIFEISEPFYCDLIAYFSECPKSIDNDELVAKMPYIYPILKKGALFPGIQEVWIDEFKREHEERLEQMLRIYISMLYHRKYYAEVVTYSDLMLMIDPTNEEIVELSITSLQKMNKGKMALSVYKHFVANYISSMGNKPAIKKPEDDDM